MRVTLPTEKYETRPACRFWYVRNYVMLAWEKFSKDTPSCPKIDFCSVVRVSIQKLGCSVVSCWNICDTPRDATFLAWFLSFEPVIMVAKLFCTAKITNLWGLLVEINKYIFGFYVSMCYAFCVHHRKPLEHLKCKWLYFAETIFRESAIPIGDKFRHGQRH